MTMGDPWEEGLERANLKKKKIEGKSQKSGKKFRLEMVLKALGTPRNAFNS